MKKPAEYNQGFDLDSDIIEAWEVARKKEKREGYWSYFYDKDFFKNIDFYLKEFNTLCGVKKEDIFIYLDPPYLLDSRLDSRKRYKHEMTTEQHQQLLDWCNQSEYKIALSHYPHDLYLKELQNWRCLSFQSKTRTGVATEHLYMNYEAPTELHDYQYLGSNFRERANIKKRQRSFNRKIAQLAPLERAMLINHIQSEYQNQ